jgi:hypothetical protein
MKSRVLILILVLPFLLAGVVGCGDDPSAKPKAATTGGKAVQEADQKQKPVPD